MPSGRYLLKVLVLAAVIRVLNGTWTEPASAQASPGTEEAKLTASDGAVDDFFGTVAISGDTVVVGAWHKRVGANESQGAAFVFVRSGGSWGQQAKLTADDGAQGRLGAITFRREHRAGVARSDRKSLDPCFIFVVRSKIPARSQIGLFWFLSTFQG